MQAASNTSSDGNVENPQMRRKAVAKNIGLWRDKLSFCIFGLTYRFGFILILSAAHDIIHNMLPEMNLATPPRQSFSISSGVVLVANVVPAHILHFLLPKLPTYFEAYMTVACLLNVASFATLALGNRVYVAFTGIVVSSLGFGIADYALTVHVGLYKSSVAKRFIAASNFSCVLASLYYVVLRELKVDMKIIFHSVIVLQCFPLLSSWLLLRRPELVSSVLSLPPEDSEFPLSIFNLAPPLKHFEDKCEYIGHLMQYILPLGSTTILQFFINQGLYEFVYFRKEFLSVDSQYRWLNFIYQLGFYACLTTKTLLVLRHIWVYVMLQFILMVYFVLDAIFFFTSFLWIVLLVAYFEGIIGGAAYINTMQKMEKKELASRIDMAEAVMKQSLSLKTILGGTLAILVHHFLCRTAEPGSR